MIKCLSYSRWDLRSTHVIALVFSNLFISHANADPAREKYHESVRAYGRGGTFVAAGESDESTFMNPATLAEPSGKTVQFRWAQIDAFIGSNTVDTISEVAKINPNQTSPVSLLQQFSSKFGKQQYVRFQGSLFGLRILSFDFAPFFSTSNWLDMRIPTTPETWIHSDSFAGANFSFAMAFGKQFNLGVTARPFFRSYFNTELAFAQIMEFEPMGSEKPADIFKLYTGAGVGFDVGAIYTVGKSTRLGLTVVDLGSTGYSLSSTKSGDQPPLIQPNLSIGIMQRLDYKPWRLDWSVDLQDLTNPENISYLRTLHTGLEFARSYRTKDNDLGVLAGLNEGYLCFGAFIDMWILRLDAISYGVELGEITGQRQDRRTAYTARSTLNF
jgi:hypothetical protein